MGKEIKIDKDLSRKEAIKLIGLVGAVPILSACDRIIHQFTTQFIPGNTPLPSSTNTPFKPNPIETLTSSKTLEPTQIPTETPTEAAPLTVEEEKKILFEEGINDRNRSVSLITTTDTKTYIGEGAMAESIVGVENIVFTGLDQGLMNWVIPAYAETKIPEIQAHYPDADIVVRQEDASGNVTPVPEGYYSVESLGYAAGGYDNRVKKGVLWLILTPPDDENMDSWMTNPVSRKGVFTTLRAQKSYADDAVWVKVPGANRPRLVQTSDGVKVVAVQNWGVKIDDYVSKIWSVDEAASYEIPFDKSNPRTITASNGQEYQGYLMEDGYGARLVDATNNIILVKDGENWREAEPRYYSEEYPAVFYETKIGHADGFDIPITLGLSRNANQAKGFNYNEAHMTQLGADDVATVFLHSAWARYADIMNHPDVTYEQYLELLKLGKGSLEILDTLTKKRVLIDPRQGFSLVITGNKTSDMPIRYLDAWGYHYTSDEKGRFLWIDNAAFKYANAFPEGSGDKYTLAENNSWFMLTTLSGIIYISVLPDKCIYVKIVNSVCGREIVPRGPDEMGNRKLFNDYMAFQEEESTDPLFTLH